jgi:hypothetical protein
MSQSPKTEKGLKFYVDKLVSIESIFYRFMIVKVAFDHFQTHYQNHLLGYLRQRFMEVIHQYYH